MVYIDIKLHVRLDLLTSSNSSRIDSSSPKHYLTKARKTLALSEVDINLSTHLI
jgi:hypothetical protein